MSVKEAARAKAHDEPAGECVDCLQCVAVCPTGVDIRKGPQLGCINCGLCIDACDTVMEKIHRPTGSSPTTTTRTASGASAARRKSFTSSVRARSCTPSLIVLVAGIMLYVLTTRANSHLSVLHVRAPLFTQTAEGGIRNGYTLRFSNKLADPQDFALEVSGIPGHRAEQRRRQTASRRPARGPARPGFDPRSAGLRDDRPGREPHGVLDAADLHRDRPEDRRAQRRDRPLLRTLTGGGMSRRGFTGAGAGAYRRYWWRETARV